MPAYQNGRLPSVALAPTVIGGQLRPDAARAADRLAVAFQAGTGVPLRATDTYRSYEQQVAVKAMKGPWAAAPGTSNHGWGVAVDFASGIDSETSATHEWMDDHAREYGWVNPGWAQDRDPRNGRFEPWHWEYDPDLDRHKGGVETKVPVHQRASSRSGGDDMAMIYRAGGERTPFGVYAHNGGWVELSTKAEFDNLKRAGVPEVWVERHTLANLIADARS